MIEHIEIKNFAIIEDATVDFNPGLNIITGETGSGKSVAVEAISLGLGSRADSSTVRTGCEKATVQLLGTLDGEEIIITREVSTSGKNICKLNGELVTLSQLNKISSKLADIHGQYDNQYLLNPDEHINFLDSYHHEEIAPLKDSLHDAYFQYASTKSTLEKLILSERENAKKKDFYRFEIDEINAADLQKDEDESLSEQINILQNSEKIYENIQRSYDSICESQGEGSALDKLGSSLKELEEISHFSGDIQSISDELGDIFYRLQDIGHSLRNQKDSLVFSPSELDKALSRQYLIDNLKKKYGETIDEILEYRDKIQSELSIIDNFEDEKTRLHSKLSSAKKELLEKCNILTSKRTEIAKELEERISEELLDLNFVDSKLEISLSPLSNPTENGMDNVEILISTNKGEPLKPLYKVASGGEMSRIMLAFKVVISAFDNIPTLIFDEIDSGISGITASIVGQKMRKIAKNRQIICITHLAQIAACGEHNYLIKKDTHGDSTTATILKLTNDDTVSEIARLIGGINITATTIQSAKELIISSKNPNII